MRKELYSVGFVVVLWTPVFGSGGEAISTGQESPPAVVGRRVEPDSVDRSNWNLKDAKAAVEKTIRMLGFESVPGALPVAEIIILEKDDTPYLSKYLIGQPLWHIVLPDRKLELPSTLEEYRVRCVRTFDVLVDPIDGRVIKLKSRWPEGVPQIAPEPDAASATEKLGRSGEEVYHGFATEDPHTSFMEALDATERAGDGPLTAKQISASLVMRSAVGFRTPRLVWAITVRGVRPVKPVEGESHEAIYQYRLIVDAKTGKYLCGGSSPQPDEDVQKYAPAQPRP